jgi:hypothetical protein
MLRIRNTTSDKGDIAVAMTIADLTSKGIKISLPISAHLPFDIIAIDENYKLSRVQVKYCDGDDKIILSTRTISISSIESVKQVNFEYIDAYAAYSPVTNKVYYVDKDFLKHKKNSLTLRIKKTDNNDSRIHYADDFLNVNTLWK